MRKWFAPAIALLDIAIVGFDLWLLFRVNRRSPSSETYPT